MYKNQLQELAQRSCFNLPSYTCIREGPDHAPRFKAIVNFNGETFDTPHFCSNLRQAEHAAAEAALISLSSRAPSHSLAARILDETGVYKNLLQEIAQRVGSPLPRYTTYRHGLGHLPVFTGIVELAGITFKGEPAKNKKQAEKNAAQAAWLSLKQLAQQDASSSSEHENTEEQEQIRIARALQNYHIKEKFKMANSNSISLPFQRNFSVPTPRSSSPQHPTISTSKILPLFCQKNASQNKPSSMISDTHSTLSQPRPSSRPSSPEIRTMSTLSQPRPSSRPPSPEIRTMSTLSQPRPSSRPPSPEIRTMSTLSQPRPSSRPPSPEIRTMQSPRFPVIGAAPYTPINLCRTPYQGIAPPISIRTSVPVFSAPPLPPPIAPSARVMQPRANQIAPPVRIRQTIPVFSASHGPKANPLSTSANSEPSKKLLAEADKESAINSTCDVDETTAIKCLEQLEI